MPQVVRGAMAWNSNAPHYLPRQTMRESWGPRIVPSEHAQGLSTIDVRQVLHIAGLRETLLELDLRALAMAAASAPPTVRGTPRSQSPSSVFHAWPKSGPESSSLTLISRLDRQLVVQFVDPTMKIHFFPSSWRTSNVLLC